ncbi:MAG: glycoside hydrolase domain-containing protein [Promethearchaeota archaeon]
MKRLKGTIGYIKKRLGLSFAVLPFLSWFLFLTDGFLLAKELEVKPLFDGLSEYLLILIPLFLLLSLLVFILRDKVQLVFSCATACGWMIFLVLWTFFLAGSPVNYLTEARILAGNFILSQPVIFILPGITSLSLLVSTLVERFKSVVRDRKSLWLDFILSATASILLCLFNEWLLSTSGLPIIGLVGAVLIFVDALFSPRRPPVVGNFNLFLGLFVFLITFLISYASMFLGQTTMFFFVADIGVILFSVGIIIAISLLELIRRIFGDRKFPWIICFTSSILIYLILGGILESELNFSDSTYRTNPPVLFAPVISGTIIGALLFSFNIAYLNFKINRRKKTRLGHEFGRFVLLGSLIIGLTTGFISGLGSDTFNKGFHEFIIISQIIAIWCGIIIFAVYFVDVYIRRRMEKRKKITKKTVNSKGTIVTKSTGKVSKKKLIISFTFVLVVIMSGVVIVAAPRVSPHAISKDDAGYPNLLGVMGDCVIAEVSPLTKVGKYSMMIKPLFKVDNPVIHRSFAKNEFESIQIIVSNFGHEPISISSVTVSNSTRGNLPSAFSRPPVLKQWKNEIWLWPRFKTQFVAEIQPGCPNIIYDLDNDNKTAAMLVAGEVRDAPEPIILPGTTISIWLTLYAADDLNCGNYYDEILIKTTGWELSITLLSKIWNFTIPENHSLRVAIGNRMVYNIPTRDEWVKNFLHHRISPYFPFEITEDFFILDGDTGEVTFNFTNFELDIQNAISHGLDTFRITFSPPGGIVGNAQAFNERFNKTAISFYSQLGNFLGNKSLGNGKTWLDLAIVYAMDEPTEEQYDEFCRWSDLVHSAHPGWKLLLTEQVEPQLEGHVDIWCPYISALNPDNIGLQHAKSCEFWYYTCCHLVDKPTVSFINPAVDHLALFWCAWAMDFDGYLFWDAQAYVGSSKHDVRNLDPFHVGYDGIGDAIMLLSDGDYMPVNTIVWETMRDGLENLEYMELLSKINPSAEILATIKQSWQGFTGYPRDYTAYLELREQLGAMINEQLTS